jgi:AcrR family transcriptional regulator
MATARRLPREARREQLVEAALGVAARRGFEGLSLEEVAEAAGVTRNLLYHYFPRGRADLVVAVVDRTAARLVDGWVVDPGIDLGERLAANFGRMADHALAPSDEWLVHRQARAIADPDVRAAGSRHIDAVVSAIARNNAGTPDPPPLLRMALQGFLAYAETALDEAREQGLDRDAVLGVLAQTLTATVAAAST